MSYKVSACTAKNSGEAETSRRRPGGGRGSSTSTSELPGRLVLSPFPFGPHGSATLLNVLLTILMLFFIVLPCVYVHTYTYILIQ